MNNINPYYISTYLDMPLYCRDELSSLIGFSNKRDFVSGWIFYGPTVYNQEVAVNLHTNLDPNTAILRRLQDRKETSIEIFFDEKYWRYIKTDEDILPIEGCAAIIDNPKEIMSYACEVLSASDYKINNINLETFNDENHKNFMKLILKLDDGAFNIESIGINVNHCALKLFKESWIMCYNYHKPSLKDICRDGIEIGRDNIGPFIKMSIERFRIIKSFKEEYIIGDEAVSILNLYRLSLNNPGFSPGVLKLKEGNFRILIN